MKNFGLENEYFDILDRLLRDTVACQYIAHTKRVVKYAKAIGAKLNADLDVLVPAAILHDVGRCEDNSLMGHVEKGLPIAKKILEDTDFDTSRTESVLLAIAEHHVDLPNQVPTSLEGKILLDADRLEIVGKYGLARWFLSFDMTTSAEDACQYWLNLSNRRIQGRRTFFCTDAGERMGIDGFRFCERYCHSILDEK